MRTGLRSVGLLVALIAACSSDFKPKACTLDSDCGSNVCELRSGAPVCVQPAQAPIVIGMSAPISGPSQALGTDMKLGVTLAFDAQNAAGGIRGRQLQLDFKDDEYTPSLAEAAARSLVDVQQSAVMPNCPTTNDPTATGQPAISTTALDRGPGAVLAFLGNVGTPTMVRAAPVAIETGTLYFGAFTGASLILRDGSAMNCSKYIFNVRASYGQEANATLQYFLNVGVPDYEHLISFDQNDTFGQAGYNGLVTAWTALKTSFSPMPMDPMNPIVRFRYTRNDETTVPPLVTQASQYLAGLLTGNSMMHTVGIMMTDTYGPGAVFIQGLRDWQFANDSQQTSLQKATRLKLYFSNVSFVGPNALAGRLKMAGTVSTPNGPMPYTQDVLVSQVVPNYQSDSSDIVSNYRQLIGNASGMPAMSFTSLEGYVDARIFIAGLLNHQGPFTADSIVSSFESLPDLSLGLGPSDGYSSTNHNYLKSVWGTSIQPDGTFQNVYFWSDGLPIQFYQ
jgi:branched-chain amino acid transport system substrate-binding protein